MLLESAKFVASFLWNRLPPPIDTISNVYTMYRRTPPDPPRPPPKMISYTFALLLLHEYVQGCGIECVMKSNVEVRAL